MDNIAQLGIKVDSSSIKQATNELSKLTNQSGKTEKGIDTLSAKTSILNAKNAVLAFATSQVVKEVIKLSDDLTNANNKLTMVSKSVEELTRSQEELYKVAQRTRQGYSETVDLYSNLASSMQDMGKTQPEIIRTVETINKAIAVSGSNAQQAASAVLQLGQAFGSGQLQGDELTPLKENALGLVKAIAEGMGVSIGKLKQLVTEGKVTSEVMFDALTKTADSVDKKFGNMTVSLGQGFTNVTNSLSTLTGEFIGATGASNDLAQIFMDISKWIDENKTDIVLYGQTTSAVIEKVIDNFMLLGADIKNVSELLLDSVGIMAFGALEPIAKMLLEVTKGLHDLGLSSDETLANSQSLYDFSNKGLTNFKQSATNNLKDIDDAYKKANVSIEDRIALMQKEWDTEKKKKFDNTSKNGNKEKERDESEIIKIAGSEYQKYTLAVETNVIALRKAGATESEINKFRADSLKDFNEKQQQESKKIADEQKRPSEEQKKSLEELSNAYIDITSTTLSDYDNALVSIAEKTQKWIEAGVNVNDVLTTQKQLVEELNIQQSLSSASDELSFLERKAQLMTDEYEKSKLLLEIKYAQSMIDIQSSDAPLEQKQMMIDKETELYNLTKERIELDRNTEFQETIKTFQEEALERQQELNAAIYDFGDSFEGAGNKISKVAKSLAAMANSEIKSKKEREKLDRKYTKQFNKYAGDVEKTKELEQEYTKETAQISDQSLTNQLDGYSALSGAVAGLYEEGTAQAQTFMIIQKALSVVSGITAIASAMANGDGYTAVARGLAVAATLASFGWGGSGGSGGSGASSSGGKKKSDQFEIKEQQIEEMYTPMTDRLDRQIELLESIDKQGSASASSLQGAGITFKRDYELAVNNILKTLPNDVRGYGLDFNQQLAGAESRLGFNIADVNRIKKSGWDKSEKRIYTDFSSLSKDFNLLKVISDYFTTGDGAIAAWFGGASKLNIAANEIQTAIGDFTMGIVSSLDDMKTASNDFKSIYDEITGSMFYENKRLAQAYTDVEKLTKGTSLAEYLKNNIDQIDFLQQTFNSAVLETLLSQDPKDMAEQIKVLEKLQTETGLVFENGAKEALDFMESIKLVGEAMANTVENRKSLIDNLEDFVDSINSTIDKPTTFKDFSSSFNEMIDAIKLGGDNLEELGNNAINSAQSYLDTIAKNAKSSAEIEFSKKVISNKFEGVINAEDITLGTINDTLKISFNEDSVIVKALNDVKNELVYLNQLNTRQTANSNKTLQLQRASIA